MWIIRANNEGLYEVLGICKLWGVCWVAAELLACQDGLCCVELDCVAYSCAA